MILPDVAPTLNRGFYVIYCHDFRLDGRELAFSGNEFMYGNTLYLTEQEAQTVQHDFLDTMLRDMPFRAVDPWLGARHLVQSFARETYDCQPSDVPEDDPFQGFIDWATDAGHDHTEAYRDESFGWIGVTYPSNLSHRDRTNFIRREAGLAEVHLGPR